MHACMDFGLFDLTYQVRAFMHAVLDAESIGILSKTF